MSLQTSTPPDAAPRPPRPEQHSPGPLRRMLGRTPRRPHPADEGPSRGVLSPADRRRASVAGVLIPIQVVMYIGVVVLCIGPVLWLAKSAISPTQEILREPFRVWPSTALWENFATAWFDLDIGRYMLNTVILTGGSVFFQVLVATTLGYGLSVLRPRYGPVVNAAVLSTLLLPPTVSLIALYLTILDLPLVNISIHNTVWAVWLPAGVHGFSVLLCRRFFDGIPRELFEAAQVDGAGPWTVFRRVVLPMSKPIITVISLLAVMASWKDFLWPLIALPEPRNQPIGVALAQIAPFVEENLLFAGLFVAALPPVLIFLLFQKHIVRGAGFTGLKG